MKPADALRDAKHRAQFPVLPAQTPVLAEFYYDDQKRRARMTLESLARAYEHPDFRILNSWLEDGTRLLPVTRRRSQELAGLGWYNEFYLYWPRD